MLLEELRVKFLSVLDGFVLLALLDDFDVLAFGVCTFATCDGLDTVIDLETGAGLATVIP